MRRMSSSAATSSAESEDVVLRITPRFVHLTGHRRGGSSPADPVAETSYQCAKGGHPAVIVTRPRLTYYRCLCPVELLAAGAAVPGDGGEAWLEERRRDATR